MPSIEVPADGLRVAGMRRGVKAAARAAQEVACGGIPGRVQAWLLTFTYREVDGWKPRDISEGLERLRKWAAGRGFTLPYVWVAELQKRGAVHYHAVLWVPKRLQVPKPDKRGWWPHGMTQCIRAVKPIGYLLKYASKGDGGVFPRGLRLHGAGGLTSEGRAVRRWLTLPGWLMVRARSFQPMRRCVGGWWVAIETGEAWRSPWRFVRFDRGTRCVIFERREDGGANAGQTVGAAAPGPARSGGTLYFSARARGRALCEAGGIA